MAITLNIDISGAMKKLSRINSGLSDLKKPLDKSGEEILKIFSEENFKNQGTSFGAPWRPLAASTLKARSRRTGYYANKPIATGKILIWTGRLQKGFKKTVERTKMIIENKVAYYRFNTDRPMIKASKEVLNIVSKNVIDFIHSLHKNG